MNERGHLYVVDGDLTRIACDAWLLPTDDDFDITEAWHSVVPVDRKWRLTGHEWPVTENGMLEIGRAHV